jgi:hypothetical protein
MARDHVCVCKICGEAQVSHSECETRPLENTDGIGRSMGEAAATESHSVAVSPTNSNPT